MRAAALNEALSFLHYSVFNSNSMADDYTSRRTRDAAQRDVVLCAKLRGRIQYLAIIIARVRRAILRASRFALDIVRVYFRNAEKDVCKCQTTTRGDVDTWHFVIQTIIAIDRYAQTRLICTMS